MCHWQTVTLTLAMRGVPADTRKAPCPECVDEYCLGGQTVSIVIAVDAYFLAQLVGDANASYGGRHTRKQGWIAERTRDR